MFNYQELLREVLPKNDFGLIKDWYNRYLETAPNEINLGSSHFVEKICLL